MEYVNVLTRSKGANMALEFLNINVSIQFLVYQMSYIW